MSNYKTRITSYILTSNLITIHIEKILKKGIKISNNNFLAIAGVGMIIDKVFGTNLVFDKEEESNQEHDAAYQDLVENTTIRDAAALYFYVRKDKLGAEAFDFLGEKSRKTIDDIWDTAGVQKSIELTKEKYDAVQLMYALMEGGILSVEENNILLKAILTKELRK